MRKLTDLLEGRKQVWFWIGEEELQRRFLQDCIACGCRLKPNQVCGRAMSLHADLTLLFVSMMPWVCSFEPGYSVSDILKVDYEKFTEGEDDYVIPKGRFKAVSLPCNS